jgi:hypothetical protein
MHEQAPLALPPPAGAAHWGADILFGSRITAALSEVNGAFLGLAAELHAARPGMPALGLPAQVLAALARPAAAPRALDLPYALFDLRFRDERFWRIETSACRAVNDPGAGGASDPRLLRFARTALTLAWHLAQTEPRVARLSLGMESATQDVLAGLPVGALDPLARRVAPAVAARFCTRERFWGLLASALRFAPDAARLQRLRLLGLQLQGAESARAQQLHRRLRHSTQA